MRDSVVVSLANTSRARRAKQKLALFGKDEAAGVAVEQGHVEAVLKPADLPADSGSGFPRRE
jgi:hypothetical protein